jgi:hypothetical protein
MLQPWHNPPARDERMADKSLLIRLKSRVSLPSASSARSNAMKRFDRMVLRGCTSAALILVTVLACPTTGWSQTAKCKPAPGVAGRVCQQIEAWGEALQASWQQKNPDLVVDKYAPDAILLPTCSADVAIGRPEIKKYFVEKFLPAEPRLTGIGTPTAGQAANVIFGSGEYEFTLKDKQGKDVVVPARYTYIFRGTGNAYLIAQHHSSLEPLNPAAKCP